MKLSRVRFLGAALVVLGLSAACAATLDAPQNTVHHPKPASKLRESHRTAAHHTATHSAASHTSAAHLSAKPATAHAATAHSNPSYPTAKSTTIRRTTATAAGGQVRRIVFFEAALLGILANVAGVTLGFILSLLLIHVINKQSFGWTIQFHWPVTVLLAALSTVYAATVLSALYPARIAAGLVPIEVIHEE